MYELLMLINRISTLPMKIKFIFRTFFGILIYLPSQLLWVKVLYCNRICLCLKKIYSKDNIPGVKLC